MLNKLEGVGNWPKWNNRTIHHIFNRLDNSTEYLPIGVVEENLEECGRDEEEFTDL